VIITTSRLQLRPLTQADTPALVEMVSHPRIAESVAIIPSDPAKGFCHTWIKRSVSGIVTGEEWILGMALPTTAGIIGNVALHRLPTPYNRPPEAELGYWLAPQYHGKGYMREACRAIVDWAFSATDIALIRSTCALTNFDSAKLLRWLGMTADGTCQLTTASGQQRPSRCFVLHRPVHPALR
jgi:RimJ/RimL family protein N-acetyltransferase